MADIAVSRTTHFALHRRAFDTSEERPIPAASLGASGFKVLFARPGAAHEAWIGALISKRWAKRAVTRNAIKRQIYIVSQALASQLPAAAHVVRLRAAFDCQQFVSATSRILKRAVRAELHKLFAQAAS